MVKRIFRSICIVAVVVLASSVILFMGVLYDYFSGMERRQLQIQTELAAKAVESEGASYFKGLDIKDYRITWIDSDGTVLYDSVSDSSEMENHLEREEIKQALSEGMGTSFRYSSTLLERSLYCAKLLDDGSILRLSIVQNTLLTLVLGMLQPICIILAITIVLSLVLAFRLSENIVKPLNGLNLDEPLKNDVYEELTPMLRRIDEQQMQIRRQNDEAEQLRREFSANVSHELKTPLHTISGCAELMANNMIKPEDMTKFSVQIYNEAQRMISLVEDIIKLSHLDEGAGDMSREDTDIYDISKEVVESLAPQAEKADVTIALKGEHAIVHGIPQLLDGIIYNLCDNAVKYNRKGGNVTVTVEKKDNSVTLSVSDTGIGIPAEHQERIFERFYRVDKSRSKEIGGTGLGLSIVKHAARLHNASINLHSSTGSGTTVTIEFPC